MTKQDSHTHRVGPGTKFVITVLNYGESPSESMALSVKSSQ